MMLVNQLIITSTLPEYKRGRPHSLPSPSRLSGRHFLELIPPTDKKAKPQKRCVVCHSHAKKKRNYLSMRCLQSSALCCTVFSSVSHEKKLLTITMVKVEIKLRYFYYLVLKKFRAFSLIYSSLTQNILRSVKRVIRVVSYETLVKKFL